MNVYDEMKLNAKKTDTDMLVTMYADSLYTLNWLDSYLGPFDDPSEKVQFQDELKVFGDELESRGIDTSKIEPHKYMELTLVSNTSVMELTRKQENEFPNEVFPF